MKVLNKMWMVWMDFRQKETNVLMNYILHKQHFKKVNKLYIYVIIMVYLRNIVFFRKLIV